MPAEQVGAAIRLFYSGTSYKQIAEYMADAYDIPEPSKATIYEWVRDYTNKGVAKMNEHKPTVGDSWVADEMQVDVGGEKMWNWNVMDEETRYILATHLSRERGAPQARAVMRKALEASAARPTTIKTDKLRSYSAALKDKDFTGIRHVQSDGIRAVNNNNLSERLQGTFRARTKTLRGMDSLETGQRYLDGWTLTYNLFREHESIGDQPPAHKAKMDVPYDEWADVVRGGREIRVEKPKPALITAPEESSPKVVKPSEPARSPKSLASPKSPRLRDARDKPLTTPPRRGGRQHPYFRNSELRGKGR